MSNRSKIALTSILSNLAWFLLLFLWRAPQAAPFSEARDAFARGWGMFFVLLIGGMVALDVLGTIMLTVREKRKGGPGFDDVTDERDKHIEKKAVYRFCLVLSACLPLAMALLALGRGLHLFFQVLAFGTLLSGLTLWGSYILGYERGM